MSYILRKEGGCVAGESFIRSLCYRAPLFMYLIKPTSTSFNLFFNMTFAPLPISNIWKKITGKSLGVLKHRCLC